MGIKDLLRFMKPYIKPISIKKYAGKRVGIDAYSWLHKGAYSCSMELCLNSGSARKLRYIDYFMHRINLLRHYNITPVVVFDGGNIPCKANTEQERHRRREANHNLAMEKLGEGNAKAASELFQKAISITPAIAHRLIQILRSENIEYVVAPYEADAQLAYLSSLDEEKGGISATVFKMDRHGNGEELVLDSVFCSEDYTPSFQNFDKKLFIGMCVLAGCDFLPSVPGIGIAKAYCMVSKYRNLDRALSVLKFEKGSQMPADYSKSFTKAVAVFQHARIYDGETKKLEHIKPLPEQLLQSLGETDFLGPEIPPSVATAIAEGRIDPISMEAFNVFPTERHPSPAVKKTSSRLEKSEITSAFRKEIGFTLTSHKTIDKESTDTMKQKLVSAETNYFKEGAALQKLLFPSEVLGKIELPEDIQLKIPDNNPFKKRKLDELQLDQIKSSGEEALAVTFTQESDDLCVNPDISLPKVLECDNCGKRKPHRSQLDQRLSNTEEVCALTEVEDSKFDFTTESQESVKSKPESKEEVRSKTEKKKLNNRNSSVNKTASILNFFSRV